MVFLIYLLVICLEYGMYIFSLYYSHYTRRNECKNKVGHRRITVFIKPTVPLAP